MGLEKKLSTYVVHYSKLKDRSDNLRSKLFQLDIEATWITEKEFETFLEVNYTSKRTIGVLNKAIGMDLGINSRSLNISRKKAKWQGYFLFLRSFLSGKNTYTTGSLPVAKRLPERWIELQFMHLTAIKRALSSKADWILVLEDDALPIGSAFDQISKIINKLELKNTWVNLNSGAGLTWTVSDPIPDENGVFIVNPAATRCAVAYLISNDLGQKIIDSANNEGVPNWLPIDVYFQVLLRKFKSKSYWQEPASFAQGSETGEYTSHLEQERKLNL
jgi:hypothetical protein